jgi:uncharacterized membrane protein
MFTYFIGVLAGRVATVLCVVAITLPYLLRRNRLTRGLGFAQAHAAPYLRRLWPHFWVGYMILALSTLHMGTVTGAMGRANSVGIWAATLAFFLLLFEIAVGLNLKDERLSARTPMRRLHFWMMIGFVSALGVHLWLNG